LKGVVSVSKIIVATPGRVGKKICDTNPAGGGGKKGE
jgi:hypothetical protein